MTETEVFIFAHPDDEFGVFFALEQALARGAQVRCLYLTDGAFASQSAARREAETRDVLTRLGTPESVIHFIGGERGYGDGQLVRHLSGALDAVASLLDPVADITAIHMHAWEGGHQDHDAAHLIAMAYAARRGLIGVARQFPLYRDGPGLLNIAVCVPLAQNGAVQSQRIPWSKRLRYLGLCLSYRSQFKSFLYLLPALAMHYLMKGTQDLQPVQTTRVVDRPHAGPLLYERRGFESSEAVFSLSAPFVAEHFPEGATST
jgi:LmbE family N-acetylglucosaminyl deacetylase